MPSQTVAATRRRKSSKGWMFTAWANNAYLTAAIITIVSVAAQGVFLLTSEPGDYEFVHTADGHLGSWFFYLLLVLFAIAQVFLWISMIFFLLRYDIVNRNETIIWSAVMILTLSAGAAVYYGIRYRRMWRRAMYAF